MPYEVLHVLASGFCIDKKRDMCNRLNEIASPGRGFFGDLEKCLVTPGPQPAHVLQCHHGAPGSDNDS